MGYFRNHSGLSYRPDIDGLRAIAVTSVVLFHTGAAGFSGGFVGVDIFFVISGYLISSIIFREVGERRFSLTTFYLRRAKRIFPALAAMLLATFTASWFLLAPKDFAAFGASLISTVVFASNIYFYGNVGYFDGEAFEKPLLHTWSLAIEEQFYLIFPLLVLLLYWRVRPSRLVALLAAGIVASLALAEFAARTAPEDAFYLLPYRGWELLIGAMIAVVVRQRPISRALAFALSLSGLAAIGLAMALLDDQSLFPGLNALLPCGGAALLILAGHGHITPIQKLLAWSPVVFVGLISYSLYLFHWPVLSLARYALNRDLAAEEATVLVVLSIALAALSWRFVELPVRHGRFGALQPIRAIAAVSLPLLLLGVLGNWVRNGEGLPSRLAPDIAAIYEVGSQRQPLRKACHGVKNALVHDDECNFGVARREGSFDMAIWGDSHADHLVPAFTDLARKHGWSGRQITESACAPLLGVRVWRTGKFVAGCDHFGEAVEDFIRRNPKLKLVVLASRWAGHATEPDHAPPGSKHQVYLIDKQDSQIAYQNTRRVMEAHLRETVSRLERAGISVVLIGQVPELSQDPLNCLARQKQAGRDAETCKISREISQRYIGYTNRLIASVAREHSPNRVQAVTLTNFLCGESNCEIELNGLPLYTDYSHLNPTGARQLADYLEQNIALFRVLGSTAMSTGGAR